MVKTVINITLAFSLMDEGDYEVSLNEKVAKISVRLERTVSRMGQIMGMEFFAPGASSVRMENDFHGMVNITRIRMELPYHVLPTKMELNENGTYRDVLGDHHKNVQKECLLYINRLMEVIRWKTRRYWVSNISGADVYLNNFDLFDDSGRNVGGQIHGQPILTLFSMSSLIMSQVSAKTTIDTALKNEERIPVHDSLYLDALDDFSKGKFNKAVTTINTALESLTTDYLLHELIKKGIPKDEAKSQIDSILSDFGKRKNGKIGYHKILTENFKEITGRSLEDKLELWTAFNDARLKRKTTIHPYVGKLSESKAKEAITSVLKVMNWVLDQERYPTS